MPIEIKDVASTIDGFATPSSVLPSDDYQKHLDTTNILVQDVNSLASAIRLLEDVIGIPIRDLNTTDTNSIVDSINSVLNVSDYRIVVGDISQLTTGDKSSVVAAINELKLTKLDASVVSAFGATLTGSANDAAARTVLGLGTAALSNSGDFSPAAHTHSYSSLTSKPTTLAGFGLDTTVYTKTQTDDAIASALVGGSGVIAGKLDASAVSAWGLTFIDDLNAAAARTTLELGTEATESSEKTIGAINRVLQQGGTVTVTAGGVISWTGRFVCQTSVGFGSTIGQYQIDCPANGTALRDLSGSTGGGMTWGSTGLAAGQTLWYILPSTAGGLIASDATRFRLGSSGSESPGRDWVMIATREIDSGHVLLGNGGRMAVGKSLLPAQMLNASYLELSGGTMTNFITLHADPSNAMHPSTKQYVDGKFAAVPSANISDSTLAGRNLLKATDLAAQKTILGIVTPAWGSITGTLSSQTDLQTALNGKSNTGHGHAISDVTNLQTSLDAKQANLGFTPVRQGGGAGQGSSSLYIGWLGSQLGLQVDATNFAGTWPISINGNAATVTTITSGQVTGALGFTPQASGVYVTSVSGSVPVDGTFRLVFNKSNGTTTTISFSIPSGGSGSSGSSCFLESATVRMSDGSLKLIKDVKVGDFVVGGGGYVNEVLALDRPLLGNRFMYHVNDDHATTAEHTHFTKNGPCYIDLDSWENDKSAGEQEVILEDGTREMWRFKSFENTKVEEFGLGSRLVHERGEVLVESLVPEMMPPETQLYNLVLNGSHTMFVNGYLVGGFIRDDDFDYRAWTQIRVTTPDDYRRP